MTMSSLITRAMLSYGKRVAMVVLLFCLGLLGWSKLTDPRLFPLRDIQIHGEMRHINQHLVQKTVMPLVKEGFFGSTCLC